MLQQLKEFCLEMKQIKKITVYLSIRSILAWPDLPFHLFLTSKWVGTTHIKSPVYLNICTFRYHFFFFSLFK